MPVGLAQMRSVAGLTLLQVAALIPPVAVVASSDLSARLLHLAVAVLAAGVFEVLFALLRKRGLSFHGVTTALIVVVFVPADIALWQIAVAVSLGTVLAELVFGGRGFGFLNPATVSLALLLISFPNVQLADPTQMLALAAMPGGLVLLALGVISGRVLLGAMLAVVLVSLVRGQGVDAVAIASALAFGLVFLMCDPVAAASTHTGRWIYGALAGCLVVVFSPATGITPQAVVFASLLASVFAPLIDHLVVLAHARSRRRRVHA